MKKNKKQSRETKFGNEFETAIDNYSDEAITETIVTNYMPYVVSVIVSRALPSIDGFKPSHRKLLYTMYKMKLLGGNKTKSANVVGQTMKLNPHGDQAIYETLVRMTTGNESLILPYVESKGNFGKVTSRDIMPAAPRYTEVRLMPICEAIFRDIDKDVVDFVDNYDGTLKEPELLPAVFPSILANSNMGIAVAMASNIASFNLRELCEATIAVIEDPENADIMSVMPAPDFSTGGEIIYDEEKMREIYETGRGSIKLRGKTEYDKKNNILLVTEIPYTTTVEIIIEKVVELIKSGKIKEVNDVRDETDLDGLKIAFDLKRGADPEVLKAKLFSLTSLTDSFGCNFNILADNRPRTMGVRQILREWISFRQECIRRVARFDIKKLSDKLHILRGLEKVLLDIDRAIEIIRNVENDSLVVPRLMEAFEIDRIQAEAVADIKLRNLNKEFILNKTGEISDIEKQIKDCQSLEKSEKLINKKIISELREISKKYGYDRKTAIVAEEKVQMELPEETVDDYNLKLFITEHGYLKKVSLVSLRSSGDHKLKEGDRITQEIEGTNTDEAIFFTNHQNAYKMKLYEIPDQKVSELGEFMANLLELEPGEEVIYVTMTKDFSGHMLFVFRNGKVAKVPLSSYETKQNRKRLIKAFADGSSVVRAFHIKTDRDLTLIRQSARETRALTVNTALIPEKVTKNTLGVQVMRLNKDSLLLSAFLSEPPAEPQAESQTEPQIEPQTKPQTEPQGADLKDSAAASDTGSQGGGTSEIMTEEEALRLERLEFAAKYRRDTIPSAGDKIDAIEALSIHKWL